MRGKSGLRQALKVEPDAAPDASAEPTARPAATPAAARRTALLKLERLYDSVLELEQLRREQPMLSDAASRETLQPAESEAAQAALAENKARYTTLIERVWEQMAVLAPLDGAPGVVHPTIALLGPAKGLRLVPRVFRHLGTDQALMFVSLLIASFDTLEVVRQAFVLDGPGVRSAARAELQNATDAFLLAVIPFILATIGPLSLRTIANLLNLLIERNDMVNVLKSKVRRRKADGADVPARHRRPDGAAQSGRAAQAGRPGVRPGGRCVGAEAVVRVRRLGLI